MAKNDEKPDETQAAAPAAPVAAPAGPTPEEKAVTDAKTALDAAQKALDTVKAEHQAAQAAHAAAVKATEPVPEIGQHIFIEGGDGAPLLRDAPDGYDGKNPARRITLNGVNYEHVADGENGVWVYRAM